MRRNIQSGLALTMGLLLLAGCATDSGPDAETTQTTRDSAESPATPDSAETSAVEYEALDTVETDLGEIEILAENLEAPWSIAFFGQTPLISERDTARILEMEADGSTREVGVVEQAASSRGEGGLLGIAIHENQLYTYLTTGPDNRIIRYSLTGEPGAYELGSPHVCFVN